MLMDEGLKLSVLRLLVAVTVTYAIFMVADEFQSPNAALRDNLTIRSGDFRRL